jgi:histidyl-tRNA synthetase
MIDHLCPDCREHFNELCERLGSMGIKYEVDPDIVRGLDYYVRTVFEFVTGAIGAQGTVCGGGRYDGLIEELGGPSLPGIGFAMGLERLLLVMAASGAQTPDEETCDLYIAPIGDKASLLAGSLVSALRAEGISADCDIMGRSLKAQMRYADKLNAAYTMVIGEDELNCKKAMLKEMDSGKQLEVLLDEKFAECFSKIIIQKQLDDTADAAMRFE